MFFEVFVLPEEIPAMERKPHHSKFELVKTDEKLKEFEANIVKPVHVLRQQEFKTRYPQGTRHARPIDLLKSPVENDKSR